MTPPYGRRDQSSSPRLQFLSASQSLRRGQRLDDSDSCSPYDNPDSSASIQSDERSIYLAQRVTTPIDSNSRFYGSLNHEDPIPEQDLAVNTSRIVPSDSQEHHSLLTDELTREGRRQRMARNLERHRKLFSDQHWQHRSRPPLSRAMSAPDSPRTLQRKALSDSSSSPGPDWPANLGPAIRPVQPQYPPPERRPTPPGVPSFGSPEALRYSAQFLMPENRARTPANLDRASPTDGQRSSSLRDAIRRMLSMPRPPRDDEHSVRGIGRAEDGTVVQGRFPYRQSGHGMHIGRQLHDHPFHAGNLSVAQSDAADTSHDPDSSDTNAKGGHGHRPSSVQPRARSSSTGNWTAPHCPFSLSPPPAPAVTRQRQPRATASLALSRNLPGSDRPSGPAPPFNSPVESSVQGTSASGDHLPSTPSRLHSVATMDARGGGGVGDADHQADAPVYADVFSWVKAQACRCCCLGGHEERNASNSLGQISSQDTYATAQSQASPAGSPAGSQDENSEVNTRYQRLHSWLSSVYGTVFPTVTEPASV
jgi:hypothetical protein